MVWSIIWAPQAIKDLRSIDQSQARRILLKLDDLAQLVDIPVQTVKSSDFSRTKKGWENCVYIKRSQWLYREDFGRSNV